MPSRAIIIYGGLLAAILLLVAGYFAFGPVGQPTISKPSHIVIATPRPGVKSAMQRIVEASLSGYIERLRSQSSNPSLQARNDEFLRAMTDVPFSQYTSTVVVVPGSGRLMKRGQTISDTPQLAAIRNALPPIRQGSFQLARITSCRVLSNRAAYVTWLEQRYDAHGHVFPPFQMGATVQFRADPGWVNIAGLTRQDLLSNETGSKGKDQTLAAIGTRLVQDPAGLLVSSVAIAPNPPPGG